MANWFHRLFRPHCPDCILERTENSICQSCETLRLALEISNREKKQLLDSILKKPEPEPVTEFNYSEVKPRAVPWNIKRQILEAEDRKAAEILKAKRAEMAATKRDDPELKALEKEMDIAAEERNNEAS